MIVTGGAAGIGRATARRFAEEGACVAAWDINESAGPGLVSELQSAGSQALFRRVDVTDAASIEPAVQEVLSRWNRIDVLINNAGIVRDSQLVKYKDGAVVSTMSDKDFDAVIAVNLRAVFLCTRAIAPHMIAAGGVILSASSVVGLYGNFGQTNYTATKAGVIAMTRTWARELGRYGIRVNAVAPGFVATEILKAMPQKVIDSMVSHTPLARMGEPEEIAEAYAWLASERASFVHGAVLSVDGGMVVGT